MYENQTLRSVFIQVFAMKKDFIATPNIQYFCLQLVHVRGALAPVAIIFCSSSVELSTVL